MSNEDLWFDLNAITSMFKDIRSRSLIINNDWRCLGSKMVEIWKNMLQEPWTRPFYETVHDELESNETEALRVTWEEVLERSLEGVDVAGIRRAMNADFPDIDVSA
jgi:hypothetical protein